MNYYYNVVYYDIVKFIVLINGFLNYKNDKNNYLFIYFKLKISL